MNKPRNARSKVVDHVPYGVYVWQLPDGRYFMDDHQNFLSIASEVGDIKRMATLARRAAEYGEPHGAPVFMAGNTKISEQEYQDQWQRQLAGEIADPLDVGAILGELRMRKNER
jgi:hypothetical protein